MASSDARPVPRKNVAYRVTFPILDADGDLVSAAASLDSEVSIDGGAFADCTNEATEIGTSGIYYLDLTSGEMNGDTVAVQVKTGTAGAKTTVIVMYPEEVGDVRINPLTIWDELEANIVTASSIGVKIKNTHPNRVTKNTALANFEFLLTDSADHVAPKTGATVTAQRSIDGGAFAACANSVTEVGSGIYKIDLAATDLNGNVITLKFSASGADTRYVTIVTQPAAA